MGRKARKSLKTSDVNAPSKTRRKLIMLPLVAVALGTAAVGINAVESNHRSLHDLNVIGQGEPVIVQIHDPGCPTCRRLKNVMTNAVGADESVLYRLADITTGKGKAFQEKYGVPHVTLLYFDDAGKLVHTTTGLQSVAEVRGLVGKAFK